MGWLSVAWETSLSPGLCSPSTGPEGKDVLTVKGSAMDMSPPPELDRAVIELIYQAIAPESTCP